MPVLRYFVFVGGALVVLLFACNAFLAPVPLPETLKSGSDLPAVRIRSERKWPERVVIDTTVATPSQVAKADPAKADIGLQASAAADTQKAREAFAQMGAAAKAPASLRPADTVAAKAAEPATFKVADATVPKATEAKPEPRRTEPRPKRRIARTHPSRSMMMVAQQPQPHFGFFDLTW